MRSGFSSVRSLGFSDLTHTLDLTHKLQRTALAAPMIRALNGWLTAPPPPSHQPDPQGFLDMIYKLRNGSGEPAGGIPLSDWQASPPLLRHTCSPATTFCPSD